MKEENIMAFCGNCGTQVQDGVKFCPACGKEVAAQQQQQQTQQGYTPPIVPGAPTQTDIQDAQANKGMAVVAYILFFIPLLTGAHKTSAFVKYHTNQGTVLFIVCIAWTIAYNILSAILLAISWRLWVVGSILGWVNVVFAVLCVLGIINAVNGKLKPLPVIGKFTIIK
jgi:uncharacterized membrane protein/predicted RNA-binding Zn-ribbon protein involved in translation (DUF1610 family)